jgi:hypothetical protein
MSLLVWMRYRDLIDASHFVAENMDQHWISFYMRNLQENMSTNLALLDWFPIHEEGKMDQNEE